MPLPAWFVSLLVGLVFLSSGCQPIVLPTATPSTPTATSEGPRPARILIVGDGWTSFGEGSLDAFLHGIAAAAQPVLEVETTTIFMLGSLKDQWDVVILEQDLAGAASNVGYYAQTVTTYQEYVRQFYDEIAATGAQTVLFATPAVLVKKKGVDDFYQANVEVATE